ncbi:3-oxoacyl-[acyl-carrier protein] reductase [Glutamicibacter mysorens]|uniref:3-oxoacyl-[acyl-carrier protein] reductase n=1 Tax=Glutamicibacter mysorens TaxID=257984 RepID=A0ABX4N414_9MICC|nr:SDR family NAD(P)-dependent oxidoreductase [Glutamicibacter mysorens]PJJ45184.1 3-oxoacyl-[acyl-carrier protein] reductase [Glutamicibacter mysorens]
MNPVANNNSSKIALITGAAQGLGESIARRLHADGFRVAIADLKDTQAKELAAKLDPAGETALGVGVDVKDLASLTACIDEVTTTWGSPDVLVNNAGKTVQRSVWDISPDEWDDVMETNLRSYLVAIQKCAPAMRDKGWGRIVNMSSFAGQQGGLVAGAHYAASKAGSLVLTKIFAKDLAASGVTVNAVAPAAILTPAMGNPSDDDLAKMSQGIPVQRVGQPEEVAAAVAYLVGPDSGYTTGTTLDVNGGVFMR